MINAKGKTVGKGRKGAQRTLKERCDPPVSKPASKSQNDCVNQSFKGTGGHTMKKVTVLGVDLAKRIFQLHGTDENGKTVLKKKIRRAELKTFIANLSPCLIGMEACGGAHYWAREFQGLGHTARLMAPQFVSPYVKTNKDDAADAEAINEAVTRPNMRFVPIKQIEHQDIQSWHRVRRGFIKRRIALTNELNGLMSEYGIVLPDKYSKLIEKIASLIDPSSEKVTSDTKQLLALMIEELKELQDRLRSCDEKLEYFSKKNEVCGRLQTIPGVGLITATAIVAAAPDPSVFKNGRQFSAWLGLVPKHEGTGGKTILRGISKRGDSYIRMLLVHGGRAVLRSAEGKTDRLSTWALEKEKTRGKKKTMVALANRNARIIWALMSSGKSYRAA